MKKTYNQLQRPINVSFLSSSLEKVSHKFWFFANRNAELFWSSQCPQPVGVIELSKKHKGRGHRYPIKVNRASKAQWLLRCCFERVNVSSPITFIWKPQGSLGIFSQFHKVCGNETSKSWRIIPHGQVQLGRTKKANRLSWAVSLKNGKSPYEYTWLGKVTLIKVRMDFHEIHYFLHLGVYRTGSTLHKIYNDIHFELQVTEQHSSKYMQVPSWNLNIHSLYCTVPVIVSWASMDWTSQHPFLTRWEMW